MGTYENANASGNNERESVIQKLIKIKGIKRKTAEALYEIGIHSYADLTYFLRQHTVEEVSAEIKKYGGNLPQGFIKKESWIKQAKEFSKKEQFTSANLEAETDSAKKLEEQRSGKKTQEHDVEFTVFFDVEESQDGKPVLHTTVYGSRDRDAGKLKHFEGNKISPWVNWMLEWADLPFAVESISPQATGIDETQASQERFVGQTIPREPFDARVEIGYVQISVVNPSAKIPDKRLRAEVHFQLSGPDAEMLASQTIPFRTEIYTIDLEKDVPDCVAFIESQLEPQQFEYTDQIEFAFPMVGRYGILAFIRSHQVGDLMAFHWGPRMRITL